MKTLSQKVVLLLYVTCKVGLTPFLGAHLKGSIVLCRYGAIFRGLKVTFFGMHLKPTLTLFQVKGGQEHGAVGVLIYSDPRDDGPITVDNGYAP